MKKFALLIAAAAALALPGAASAQHAQPCAAKSCHARIVVKGAARWSSPQRLSGSLDELSLSVGREDLTYEQVNSCVAYFYGNGLVVRLSSCGHGSVPIKIRAVRLDPRAVTLRLSYRVAR